MSRINKTFLISLGKSSSTSEYTVRNDGVSLPIVLYLHPRRGIEDAPIIVMNELVSGPPLVFLLFLLLCQLFPRLHYSPTSNDESAINWESNGSTKIIFAVRTVESHHERTCITRAYDC